MRNPLLWILILVVSATAREIHLKCNDNYVHFNDQTIESCSVQSLTVTSSDDILVSVNGDNKTTNYKSVEIDGKVVKFIPKQFGYFFARAKRLIIRDSQLQSIDKNDLAAFSQLSHLGLEKNKLSSLDGDLFEFNPELNTIDFDYNQLEHIGEDLMDKLDNLRSALFSGNICISMRSSDGNSIKIIKSSISKSCLSIKNLKRKYCSKDIQALEDKIKSLEEEKLKSLKMYEKCDGTLDIATKKLLETTKQAKACDKVEERMSDDANKEKIEIDVKVVYTFLSVSSLEAVELRVDSPGALIRKIELPSDPAYSEEVNAVGKQISFSAINQQTFFFPINLGDHLPQLKHLLIVSSGLFEIEARIFETLSELQELIIKDNKLQEIPNDAFNNLKNLYELDLSFNNIRSLDRNVFKDLAELTKLNLGHNLLATIDGTTFDNLKVLESLAINDNKLQFISANLVTPLFQIHSRVRTLNLSNNICIDLDLSKSSLTAIEAQIIDSCIAPIKVQCNIEAPAANSDNKTTDRMCEAVELAIEYPKTKISKVNDEVNNDVTILSITNQQALYLPFQLAQTFSKLEKFIVENSKLIALMRQDFDGLKSLKHVVITFNNITSIEDGTFDDVTQLEHLNLASNNIKSLPNKLFSQLSKLKILILTKNLLRKFTANLLPPKNVIEEFHIDNNQLELIETKTLRFLRKAKLIDMTENVCIDLKYEKSLNNSRALIELSGEIDLNCSEDDMRKR